MGWFANFKIRTKLLLSLLPLGLIVIGALVFASTEMARIDARYSELLESKVKAIMAVNRSNQRTIQINQELYELIAENDADKLIRIEAEIEKTIRAFHDLIDEAKKYSPRDAPQLVDIEKLFDNFIIETKVIRVRAQQNTDSGALELMRERIKPLFTATRAASAKLAEAMRADLEKASATAVADTGQAIRLTWLAVVIGLVLSLAMALSIAQAGVVRPLQQIDRAGRRRQAAWPRPRRQNPSAGQRTDWRRDCRDNEFPGLRAGHRCPAGNLARWGRPPWCGSPRGCRARNPTGAGRAAAGRGWPRG